MNDLTQLLEKVGTGEDPKAAEKLLDLVYRELRQMAEGKMHNQPPTQTLQPTILVHDMWFKLFPDGRNPKFEGRKHFFGAASNAMRRILVDHARRYNAKKRGERVEMSETQLAEQLEESEERKSHDLRLAVDEALKAYAEVDKCTAKLVELRFFGGLTMEQAADVLDISLRTAERNYRLFKAWLVKRFKKQVDI
jgi:RNA polymerase sigma factor (TIGR02999 family)